jgi:hypothetical protein
MINTGIIRTATGEWWIELNTTANAIAEADDISKITYDFDLVDAQDAIEAVGVLPGAVSVSYNDTLNNLSSLYDTLEAEIGTPTGSGYPTIRAVLNRRPYGQSAIQKFPFQAQFVGVEHNELEGMTRVRLLPPTQDATTVQDYFENVTGYLPATSYPFVRSGSLVTEAYAPGDFIFSLIENMNPSGATPTPYLVASANVSQAGYGPFIYSESTDITAEQRNYFVLNSIATAPAFNNDRIYDKLRGMAGLDGAVYGSAFGVNFYVARTRTDSRVTLTFDDVVNLKLLPSQRDIITQTFVMNVNAGVTDLTSNTNVRNYNPSGARTVGIDYSAHIPILSKGTLNTATGNVNAFGGTADIERITTNVAQNAYAKAFGSQSWYAKQIRIELEVLNIDKIRPWQTFEFDASDPDIPDRYKNKVFRPSSLEYDIVQDKAVITAYQL